MKLTYYGQSCFGVEIGGKHLLFDPFITSNPLAKNVKIDDIPCDYMLISHGHGDHIADAEAIIQRTNCTVVAGVEVAVWLGKKGAKQTRQMNIGGVAHFDFGSVRCVVAQHSSSLPDGSYGGNPMGFVVECPEGVFYFAGDTALTLDMQLLPMICAPLDVAILPIGDNYTMGYHDAIIAADFIQCTTVIGCHYDTFDAIKIDKEAAKAAFEEEEKELILLEIGEELEFE